MDNLRLLATIALREYVGMDPRLIAELVLRLGPPEELIESPDLESLPDTLLAPELRAAIHTCPMRFPEIRSPP